jgi:hypothetical protein
MSIDIDDLEDAYMEEETLHIKEVTIQQSTCYHSSLITKRVEEVAYMQNKFCRLLHAGRNKIHTLYICVIPRACRTRKPPNKVEFLCFVSIAHTHNLVTSYAPCVCISLALITPYQQQIIQHIHTSS